MSKGGIIIRLIDVVLNLLLGFICISDFTVKAQVMLPKTINDSSQIQRQKIICIRIHENGQFEIDDGITKLLGITELHQVEQEMLRQKNLNPDLNVIIEPDVDSIIQITVDLLDLCEKYQIPKTISYEL